MLFKLFKIQLWLHFLVFALPVGGIIVLNLLWGNAFGNLQITYIFESFLGAEESLFDLTIPLILTIIALYLWRENKLWLAWSTHVFYLFYLIVIGSISCSVFPTCSIFSWSLNALPAWLGTILSLVIAWKVKFAFTNQLIGAELPVTQKRLYSFLIWLSALLLLATQIFMFF